MIFGLLDTGQYMLLVILVLSSILLFGEWIRVDLTAALIILALSITKILEPEEALSGFSSEPAIMVALIFVLSGALFHTGLSKQLGNLIQRLAGRNFERIQAVVMPSVGLLAAFTHHVTLTAIMVPVMLRISRENNVAASRLLMPMSFAASLGTTITIIGAPAFLISSNLLEQAGEPPLGIFSIAPIGLALTLAGTAFVLLLGRFLLPDHPNKEEPTEHFRLEGYYTELVILPDSPTVGKTIEELEAGEEPDFHIVTWFRGRQARSKPYGNKRVKAGDVLLVRINPDKLATIEQERGVALEPLQKYGDEVSLKKNEDNDIPSQLVQAVIAPRSDLIGRTIGTIKFLRNYGVIVVSVWRQRGWIRSELSKVRIREGDVLVMVGDSDSLRRITENSSFLLLTPFQGEPKPLRKARLAGAIMLLSILLAAFNILPVVIALLAGAVTVILSGCVTLRQAYQSIDTRIYVFIAGAIPLGLAMQKTGTADLLAGWLQALVANWDTHLVLLVLFIAAGIITQIMSDAATVALLGPIAIALAENLNASPSAFIVTVAMAAVVSFLTPIGHHGNLLIYGPGNYRFSDFVRVGAPLTVVTAAIVVLLAPLIWPG